MNNKALKHSRRVMKKLLTKDVARYTLVKSKKGWLTLTKKWGIVAVASIAAFTTLSINLGSSQAKADTGSYSENHEETSENTVLQQRRVVINTNKAAVNTAKDNDQTDKKTDDNTNKAAVNTAKDNDQTDKKTDDNTNKAAVNTAKDNDQTDKKTDDNTNKAAVNTAKDNDQTDKKTDDNTNKAAVNTAKDNDQTDKKTDDNTNKAAVNTAKDNDQTDKKTDDNTNKAAVNTAKDNDQTDKKTDDNTNKAAVNTAKDNDQTDKKTDDNTNKAAVNTAKDNDQTDQKAKLKAIVAKTIAVINNDHTLSEADKKLKNAAMDKALYAGNTAIDLAVDTDSVEKAYMDSEVTINNIYNVLANKQPEEKFDRKLSENEGKALEQEKNNESKEIHPKESKVGQKAFFSPSGYPMDIGPNFVTVQVYVLGPNTVHGGDYTNSKKFVIVSMNRKTKEFYITGVNDGIIESYDNLGKSSSQFNYNSKSSAKYFFKNKTAFAYWRGEGTLVVNSQGNGSQELMGQMLKEGVGHLKPEGQTYEAGVAYISNANKYVHLISSSKTIQEGNNQITGFGYAGDKINILDKKANKVLGSTIINPDGSFIFVLPDGGYFIKDQIITLSPVSSESSNIDIEVAANTELDKARDSAKTIISKLTHIEKSAKDNYIAKVTKSINIDEIKGIAETAQKEDAKNGLKKSLETVDEKIKQDKSLLAAEKTRQSKTASDEYDKAIEKINNAKDTDGINGEYTAGVKAIESAYQAGEKLDDQKKAQQASLQKVADDTNKAIDADKTLTKDAKAAQHAGVATELDKGTQAIKAATDADGIKTAYTSGEKAIKEQYKPGQAIDDQKKAQQASLQKVADDTNKAIDADKTLSKEVKAAQHAAVATELDKGTQAIKAATDADGINTAYTSGEKAIKEQYKPGQAIDDQKKTQQASLQKVADDTNKAIDADKTLSKEVKAAQHAAVATELDKGTQAIKAATDADGINTAYTSGEKAIKEQYKPGQAIDDQKKTQQASLQKVADDTNKAIDADKTLTKDAKDKQHAAVATELDKGTQAIKAATDADGIKTAYTSGEKAIKEQYKPGQAIDDQKKAQQASLQKVADDTNKAIDADETLSKEVKAAQHAAVATELDKGTQAIKAATDADGINTAYTSGEKAIKEQYKPGQAIDDQKKTQQASLQKVADDTNKAIDADKTLTKDAKAAQHAAVATELDKGTQAIKAATDADGINTAYTSGEKAIKEQYKPGQAIDDHKKAQQASLQKVADDTNKAIDADKTLTKDAKAAQHAAVATELDKGTQAIKAATDADGIREAYSNGAIKIRDQHQPGNGGTVDDQKAAKKAKLNDVANNTNDAIDSDKTLTKDDKDKQHVGVATELDKGTKAIDKATDADSVNSAYNTGAKQIRAQHQPGNGGTTDDQKAAKKAKLTDVANDTNDAINSDKTLTKDAKDKQHAGVAAELVKGNAAIDAATDADGINTAYTSGEKAIKEQYKPGQAIDDHKKAQQASLQKVADDTNKAIDADKTLTKDAKAAQHAAVATELDKGTQAIKAATDADGIREAYSNGAIKIRDQHQPGNGGTVDDQKAAKKAKLNDVANNTNDAIDSDKTLTKDDKDKQHVGVATELDKGTKAIDKATDADSVNSAYNTGAKQIRAQHQPGSGGTTDDQKAAKKAKLTDVANDTNDAINSDKTLTKDAKDKQHAGVAAELVKGNAAIDAATDADGINTAYTSGEKAIKEQYKPGQAIDDHKKAQQASLQKVADDTNKAIDADKTLTKDAKAAQHAAVATELDKGTQAIKAATDADGVREAYSNGAIKIRDQHQPGNGGTVDDQKAAKKAKLNDVANNTNDAIDSDKTLTKDDKDKQHVGVATELDKGTKAIDKATDADSVNSAYNTGAKQIRAQHQPGNGGTTDDQKAAKKAKLTDVANDTNDAINSDKTLTKDAKDKQHAGVAAELVKGNAAIDAANDADGINTAYTSGEKAIKEQYKPGQAIDDHKKAQQASLQKVADDTNKAIDADKTLTKDAKAAQHAAVATELDKGTQAIKAATDADGINTAYTSGEKAIKEQYKPGQAIDDQKKTQQASLQKVADDTNKAIDADKTLTKDAKDKQHAAVATELDKGTQGIKAATDADGINTAYTSGEKAIKEQYKPGQAIDDHKKAQQASLQKVADDTNKAIDADKTLTKDAKAAQHAAVATELDKGTQAIKAATDADGINTAYTSGEKAIKEQYKPGQAIDDQKKTQQASLQKVADDTNKAIDADKTLTKDAKAAQHAAVATELDKGTQAIKAATDADGINTAYTSGEKAIKEQYKPGQAIDDHKKAQQASLQKVADDTNKAIDADKTLTKDAKAAQHAAVATELDKGTQAIKAATDADGIREAYSNGAIKIRDQHQPGNGGTVDDQKAAKKAKLNDVANNTNDAIDSDKTLTKDDKDKQHVGVATELDKGTKAIDKATDADSVNSAYNTGAKQIRAQHQPGNGGTTDDQKAAKKAKLTDVANDTNDAINSDKTLTKDAKDKQHAGVAAELVKGNAAIDAATDADGINTAYTSGEKAIKEQYKPGQAIDDHKKAQQASLQKVADDTNKAIDADKTLTKDAKAAQHAAVATELDKGTQAIKAATDADGIREAYSNGAIKIRDQHQPGNGGTVDDQKAAKKAKLNDVANNTNDAIDSDKTLTKDDKDKQHVGVATELDKGTKAIDKATDADSVNSAYNTGAKQIRAQHQPGSGGTTDDQKAAKKAKLTDVANDTNDAINSDKTLTKDAKDKQHAGVAAELVKGNAAIDAATDADGINTAYTSGEKAIKEQYKPGQAIDDHKKAQQASLQKVADDTNKAIDADKTLTKDAKAAQHAAVATELDKGTQAIKAATDADGVREAYSNGAIKIRDQHQPGNGGTVDDQKAAKKAKLNDVANNTNDAIDSDKTLTKDDKDKQHVGVATELDKGTKAIDKATDADSVNSAYNTGAKQIRAQHQPGNGGTTDDQKAAKKAKLTDVANDTNDAINSDKTLTKDAKDKQHAGVAAELVKGNAAIDAATDADGINTAYTSGEKAIKEQYKPGQAIDDHKKAQQASLQKVADDTNKAIDADKTLTKDAKAAQHAAVATELDKGTQAIKAATDADGINTAYTSGEKAIKEQYKPGQAIDDQKKTQQASLQKVADDTNKAIDADKTLTKDAKDKQHAAVATELDKGTQGIKAATDADGINTAYTSGEKAIKEQYKPGQAIDDHKKAQQASLQKVADDTNKAIDADKTLTKDAKAAQHAAVATELDKGTQAIKAATDADGINTAYTSGEKAIKEQYKPGQAIDDQKKTQQASLQKVADDTNKAIDADKTLTKDAKAAQHAAVATELDKGTQAIKAATDADGINTAYTSGEKAIKEQYKPGQAIDDHKKAQQASLQKVADDTNKAIDADKTLTKDAKAAQHAAVATELDKGTQAIKAATDADGIREAYSNGAIKIRDQHQPGNGGTVDDQKAAKKAKLNDVANNTNDAIDSDKTLTKDDKDKQHVGVATELDKGTKAIDKATDADSVNSAYNTGAKQIRAQHQPGSGGTTDDQKAAKKAKLTDVANDTNDAINSDKTLTKDAKDKQHAGVAAELVKGNAAIDAATDADGINTAYTSGEKAIKEQYKPGQAIDDHKKAQQASLQKVADDTNKAIDADKTLTKDAKAAQHAAVATELDKGTQAIKAATDADGVREAYSNGAIKIRDQHQPGNGGTVDDQKAAKKAKLNDVANNTNDAIDSDKTLTKDDKDKQHVGVATELDKGTKAIDKATDADSVNSAYNTGAKQIRAQHQPGNGGTTDDQKAAKKAKLTDVANDTNDAINSDKTLTKDAKDKQHAGVAAELVKGNAAIDAANDADGINTAYTSGEKAIKEQYKPGQAIDDHKKAQQASLQKVADDTNKAIDADKTLTKDAKAAQHAAVATELDKGTQAIKAATDADGVREAYSNGAIKIRDQHQPGNGGTVDDQKAAKKAKLNDVANNTNDAIDSDKTLTKDDKDKQHVGVATELDKGTKAIDKATDADSVNSAYNTGAKQIRAQHQPGNGGTTDDQKAAKKAKLTDVANDTNDAINSDKTLTKDAKDKQHAGVAAELVKGNAAIDAATDADGINTAYTSGEKAIKGQHKSGKKLSEQKASYKHLLDIVANTTRRLINADKNLDSTQKTIQLDNVNKVLKYWNALINKSSDSDSIRINYKIGSVDIRKQYVAGQDISKHRNTQKKMLNSIADKINSLITRDKALTNSEKKSQHKRVAEELLKGNAEIDAATDADGIDTAYTNGKKAIEAQYKSGKGGSIPENKQKQRARLDRIAKNTIAKIKSDKYLSDVEKEKQVKAVIRELIIGNKNINYSTNADEIIIAYNKGQKDIEKQYKPGEKNSLVENKKTAKTLISNLVNLTKKEKQHFNILIDGSNGFVEIDSIVNEAKILDKSRNKTIDSKEGMLPQTGDQEYNNIFLSIVGMLMLSLTALGSVFIRKDDDK